MPEFGFNGLKLDGCGAQTDMQLWDGVFKADGEQCRRRLALPPYFRPRLVVVG